MLSRRVTLPPSSLVVEYGRSMTSEPEKLDYIIENSSSKVTLVLALLSGLTLSVIGLRFLFDPLNAATFFGVANDGQGFALHYAVAFRDLWLGLIAIAFALFRDWRALMIWLVFGAAVCFADAWIAANWSGRWVSVTFHIAAGVFCAALARMCWMQINAAGANSAEDSEGIADTEDQTPA